MTRYTTGTAFFLIAISATAWAAGPGQQIDPCFKHLPPECSIDKSVTLTEDQVAGIAKKLGGAVKKLSNNDLTVQGQPILVNIFDTPTEADAIKVYKAISAMKGDPAYCVRQRTRVIEYVCKGPSDPDMVTKISWISWELGFVPKPKAIRYRIAAKVATVDKADYMASTRLMNLLAGVNPVHPDADAVSQINALLKDYRFGSRLVLRTPQQGAPRVAYSFAPAPDKKEDSSNHESSIYSFGTPMRMLNIPYVVMTAEIAVDDTGLTPTSRKTDKALLAGTKFWPVEDADVVALAGKITSGRNTDQAKVQAILEWLTPGKNIEFGGPVVGSRWGVKKVLNQKQGCCWDFSDCFVTLARASGIPCRQVGGWLYETSGHVWAEVLVDGKHWQQVDPTGGGKLKCGIYYIPYFATEDGNMPIQYVSIPKIEIVEPK